MSTIRFQICSRPLNSMGVNCVGPRTHGRFSWTRAAVLRCLKLVEFTETEPWIGGLTVKLDADFQGHRGSVSLTPSCSQVTVFEGESGTCQDLKSGSWVPEPSLLTLCSAVVPSQGSRFGRGVRNSIQKSSRVRGITFTGFSYLRSTVVWKRLNGKFQK